jgi:tripartite-type tricarboxylate transporter receptor subunit TctC
MPNRRSMNGIVLAGMMFLLGLGAGQAEDYPSRPLRLIITTPAGSLVDVLGRLFAQDLSERLGQTIVVDNRPGAMTQLGADALNRAPPDGYTLMIATSESTMLPFLKKSYRYDPVTDFTPIALLATSWTVFAVNPKVPANTLAELIAYSKANPGRLRYGSGGVGGALHIAVEMLRLKTGADLVHVPYRGGGQAASDAVAGQIEMVSLGLASARVAEGRALRLLAQTGPRRHPMFAAVPTTAELGMPDVRMDTWFGLIAPPQTPEPIVARLVRESDAVVNRAALPREVVSHRLRRSVDAADAVQRIHARRHQEMGKAHPGNGHSDRRLVPNPRSKTGARFDGKRIDVAERQEGRRLGDRDVRDLGG